MLYYFEVMKDNVSICIDSDIRYYHHFKIGDVILITMDADFGITLKHDCIKVFNPSLTLDWDKTFSGIPGDDEPTRLSISTCIRKDIIVDITKNVDRDYKLNLILQ